MRFSCLFLPTGWLFLLSLLIPAARAQESLGSWNILNISALVTDRVGVFGEAQIRSLRFYDHFHYYEYKGGISWKVNSQLSLLGGAGRYDTYSAGGDFRSPRLTKEYRTWLQAGLRNGMGRWKVDHRYRAEQRFTNNGYRNRFRYRIGVTWELPFQRNGKRPFYVNASNETFFTNRPPYFERNRLFAGMGWEISELLTIQCGYLHQFDYRLTDEIGRDFLQVGAYIDFGRLDSKTLPVIGDAD